MDMVLEIVLTVVVALVVALGALFLFERRSRAFFTEERERRNEKNEADNSSLRDQRAAVEKIVDKIKRDLEMHQDKMVRAEKDRTDQFSKVATVVKEHKEQVSDLKASTDDLKNILSNNQLRGKYGEEVAENLLLSVGFVKGQHYSTNTKQETHSTRPDITVLLPDNTKVHVDVKFPYQALVRYEKTEDKQEREQLLAQFKSDVKARVKEIESRDYINPEEGTVDFAVLFVPNEMIFSFIYHHLSDVWEEAFQKRIIMAGPFSFTAIVRMVYQAYRNFTYQENMRDIIKLVETFSKEWDKFSGAVDTLGNRLESVNKQYREVSVTRAKKLGGVIDKIVAEEVLPEKPEPTRLAE